MSLSRRDFIKVTALTMISASDASAWEGKESLLRPPGALDEQDFLSKCNRCQKCVQTCPTKVITPASLKHGFLNLNTPTVTFKNDFCNSCLECSLECPTGALLPVTKETLDIGLAVIVEKDCVAWDWVGCTVCVDNCPMKAIYLDESKRPVVIPERCNGCGICELKCPSASLRSSILGKGVVIRRRPDGVPPKDPNYIVTEEQK